MEPFTTVYLIMAILGAADALVGSANSAKNSDMIADVTRWVSSNSNQLSKLANNLSNDYQDISAFINSVQGLPGFSQLRKRIQAENINPAIRGAKAKIAASNKLNDLNTQIANVEKVLSKYQSTGSWTGDIAKNITTAFDRDRKLKDKGADANTRWHSFFAGRQKEISQARKDLDNLRNEADKIYTQYNLTSPSELSSQRNKP